MVLELEWGYQVVLEALELWWEVGSAVLLPVRPVVLLQLPETFWDFNVLIC